MKRRSLLTSLGVGLTGLTGCLGLGGGSSSGGDGGSSGGPTATPTFTPLPGPAQFSLETINASGQTEAGSEYTFEVAVRNTGGRPGVYRAPVKVRQRGENTFTEVNQVSVYVEPGETQHAQVTVPAFDYVGNANVRVGSARNQWSVSIVGRELSFRETFVTPGNLAITVQRIQLTDSYTYEGPSGEQEATAPDGQQWAFVYVTAANRGELADFSPAPEQFTLFVGDSPKTTAFVSRTENRYVETEIANGESVRGWIPFRVSADATVQDMTVTWESNDLEATWLPNRGGSGESDSGS